MTTRQISYPVDKHTHHPRLAICCGEHYQSSNRTLPAINLRAVRSSTFSRPTPRCSQLLLGDFIPSCWSITPPCPALPPPPPPPSSRLVAPPASGTAHRRRPPVSHWPPRQCTLDPSLAHPILLLLHVHSTKRVARSCAVDFQAGKVGLDNRSQRRHGHFRYATFTYGPWTR